MIKEFNYNLELYNNKICTLEKPDEFRRISAEARNIELYFCERTSCLDEIRECILMSYRFNKDLSMRNRINFVRGIAYSKHYIDNNDLNDFREHLEVYDKSVFDEQSIFKQINYEDDIIDDNIMAELLSDNLPIEQLEINLKNQPKEILKMEPIKEDQKIDTQIEEENSDDNEEELFEDEYIDEQNYMSSLLSPEDKLSYIKGSYEHYASLVLKIKNITNSQEKKYVKKGMDAWFNYIYVQLNNLYEMNQNLNILNDKSLFKSI